MNKIQAVTFLRIPYNFPLHLHNQSYQFSSILDGQMDFKPSIEKKNFDTDLNIYTQETATAVSVPAGCLSLHNLQSEIRNIGYYSYWSTVYSLRGSVDTCSEPNQTCVERCVHTTRARTDDTGSHLLAVYRLLIQWLCTRTAMGLAEPLFEVPPPRWATLGQGSYGSRCLVTGSWNRPHLQGHTRRSMNPRRSKTRDAP